MTNNHNLELVLELLETIEKGKEAIINQNRFMARPLIESLERRVLTIKSVHPQSHVLYKIVALLHKDVLTNLYTNLEAMEAQK